MKGSKNLRRIGVQSWLKYHYRNTSLKKSHMNSVRLLAWEYTSWVHVKLLCIVVHAAEIIQWSSDGSLDDKFWLFVSKFRTSKIVWNLFNWSPFYIGYIFMQNILQKLTILNSVICGMQWCTHALHTTTELYKAYLSFVLSYSLCDD